MTYSHGMYTLLATIAHLTQPTASSIRNPGTNAPHPSTPLYTLTSIGLCQLLAQQTVPSDTTANVVHHPCHSLGVTIDDLRFAHLGIFKPSALHQRLS
jgi:hypothetical protein